MLLSTKDWGLNSASRPGFPRSILLSEVSGCDRFLLGHWNCIKERLHRGLPETPAALVGALFVVVADPQIEINLQLVDRTVQLFAERNPIKLVEQSFVEALTNAIIRYGIRRRLAVRLFPEGKRQYGEPIRDTGRREH